MPPKKNKRLWLNKIGLFEIIPNSGGGDCLFHAISQALHYSYVQSMNPKMHPKSNLKSVNLYSKSYSPSLIRKEIVTYLTKSPKGSKLWSELRPELLSFWKYYSPDYPNTTRTPNSLETRANTCCCFQKHRKNPDYFKEFYAHRMSQVGEPGTVYELRVAANLYGFHFDYLDTISPETSSNTSKPLPLDTEKRLLYSKSHVNSVNTDNADEDRQVVLCWRRIFQFYSCRNNACKVPRGINLLGIKDKNKKELKPSCIRDCNNATTNATTNDINPTNAYPSIRNNNETNNEIKNKHFYLMYTRYSNLEGHWELIRPIYLRQFPVPLHQKIFGIIYPTRALTTTEEDSFTGVDSIAEKIEAQIRSGEIQIPPEDPDWPADDRDNFVGCLEGCYKPFHKLYRVGECSNHSKKACFKTKFIKSCSKTKVFNVLKRFRKFLKMFRKIKVASMS